MLKNSVLVIAVLLILISMPLTSATEFILRADGQPIAKYENNNPTYILYGENNLPIAEIDKDGNVVKTYEYGPMLEPKGESADFATNNYDPDLELYIGLDAIKVYDSDGNIVSRGVYDPEIGSEISKTPSKDFLKDAIPSAEPLDYPESLWAFEHQGYDLATTPEVGSETPYKPNTWKWLESLTPEQRQEYADKGIYRHFLGESLKISYQLAFMSMYAKAATTPPQPTRGNLVRQGILGRTSQNQAALRFLAAHTTTPTSMAESKYAYITRYANDEELMEYARRGYVFHPKGETLYVTPDYYSSASAAHGPLALPGEIRQGFVRISTRHLSGIPAVDATVVQSQTQTFGPHAVGGGLEIAFPPGTTIPLK